MHFRRHVASFNTALKRIAHVRTSRPNWRCDSNSQHKMKVNPQRDPVF